MNTDNTCNDNKERDFDRYLKYFWGTDIKKIYEELHSVLDKNKSSFMIMVCIENYDNTPAYEGPRAAEIISRLEDLLDERPGRYFRFNHGAMYFSLDIFPKEKDGIKYISQFDKAIDLIRKDHYDKSVMQVIAPHMIQARIGPVPAVISVILKPRFENGEKYLDVIATYREQEFSTWWPLNILELSRIQERALKELESWNYLKGNIITVAAQGYWYPNVRLGNKSLIDDEAGANECAKNTVTAFNFGCKREERKKKCEEIISDLMEKKENTSISSFDSIGLLIMMKKLCFIKTMLESNTSDSIDQATLEEFKKSRNKIEYDMNILISKFKEFSDNQYNTVKAQGDRWKQEVDGLFEAIIKEFENLKARLS